MDVHGSRCGSEEELLLEASGSCGADLELRAARGLSDQTFPALDAASWTGLADDDLPWGCQCFLQFWERRTRSDVPVLFLPPLAPKDMVLLVRGKRKNWSEHVVRNVLASSMSPASSHTFSVHLKVTGLLLSTNCIFRSPSCSRVQPSPAAAQPP